MQTMKTFELVQDINEQINEFMSDIGISPRLCEYHHVFNENTNKYSGKIVLTGYNEDDAADLIREFRENCYDFSFQLAAEFPKTKIDLSISFRDEEGSVDSCLPDLDDEAEDDQDATDDTEYEEQATDDEELPDQWVGDPDQDDDTDSDIRQYEEEGMSIVEGDDVDEDDEDDDIEAVAKRMRSGDDDDEDDDDYPGSELDELDDEDSYIPSREDFEDLWNAFGDHDDE